MLNSVGFGLKNRGSCDIIVLLSKNGRICIAIEKGFQESGEKIRKMGYRLESLAIVESMDAASETVVFRKSF